MFDNDAWNSSEYFHRVDGFISNFYTTYSTCNKIIYILTCPQSHKTDEIKLTNNPWQHGKNLPVNYFFLSDANDKTNELHIIHVLFPCQNCSYMYTCLC